MSDTIRYVENPLSIDRPGIGVNLIYLMLEGVLFFALTLLLEVCSTDFHTAFTSGFFYRMAFSLLRSVECLSNTLKTVKLARSQQMNHCYFMARYSQFCSPKFTSSIYSG